MTDIQADYLIKSQYNSLLNKVKFQKEIAKILKIKPKSLRDKINREDIHFPYKHRNFILKALKMQLELDNMYINEQKEMYNKLKKYTRKNNIYKKPLFLVHEH